MKNSKIKQAIFAAAFLTLAAPLLAAPAPGLHDAKPANRALAVNDIADKRDKTAVPDLISLLQTEQNINVQGTVVRALGTLGDPSADKPLLDLYAKAKDQGMKNVILISIGYINDPAVVPDLFRIIDRETDLGPRIRAVVMLSGFPATKAIRDKLEALADNEKEDENIRKVAVEAFMRLAGNDDAESVKALRRIHGKVANDKVKKYTEKRMKDKNIQ